MSGGRIPDMYVVLSEAEQRLAKFLASARYHNARRKGLHDAKMGDQSNELTDLEGIASEIAFCKLMNIYPDLDLDHTNAADCFLRDGRAVDVKSTVYKSGRLLSVRWKDASKVDVFVLMVGQFPKYRCAGFLESAELIKDERLTDFGHGTGYAAAQSDLKPVSLLNLKRQEIDW
jgi:hypothetical protein